MPGRRQPPLSRAPRYAVTVRPSTSSARASLAISVMPTTSAAAAQTVQRTTTREHTRPRIGCAAKRRGRQRAGNPSWFSTVGDRSVASAFSLADRGGVEQRLRGRPLCSTHVIKKPRSSSSQQRFNGTMEPISNLPSNSPRSSAPRSDCSLYWKGLPGAASRSRSVTARNPIRNYECLFPRPTRSPSWTRRPSSANVRPGHSGTDVLSPRLNFNRTNLMFGTIDTSSVPRSSVARSSVTVALP